MYLLPDVDFDRSRTSASAFARSAAVLLKMTPVAFAQAPSGDGDFGHRVPPAEQFGAGETPGLASVHHAGSFSPM
jgi:hypothetical protein